MELKFLVKTFTNSCTPLEDGLFTGNSLKCKRITTRHLEIKISYENKTFLIKWKGMTYLSLIFLLFLSFIFFLCFLSAEAFLCFSLFFFLARFFF